MTGLPPDGPARPRTRPTRPAAAPTPTVVDATGEERSATGTAQGVLQPDVIGRVSNPHQFPPQPELARYVEWAWTVAWHLPDGEVQRAEVLPHPAVSITVELGSDRTRHGQNLPAVLVHGVSPKRFQVALSGRGSATGVRFRPGGFAALTGVDAVDTRGRVLRLERFLGQSVLDLLGRVEELVDPERMADALQGLLSKHLPDPDPAYDDLLDVLALVVADPTLLTVGQVCDAVGRSERGLQRLFRRFIGLGPKWVLARARLHDAVSLLDAGWDDDLAALAASLGWYDQSHFTRDFTALVGVAPSVYADQRRRRLAENRPPPGDRP